MLSALGRIEINRGAGVVRDRMPRWCLKAIQYLKNIWLGFWKRLDETYFCSDHHRVMASAHIHTGYRGKGVVRGALKSVWPNVGIKVVQIVPNDAQKVATTVFTWKVMFDALFCKKICPQELSKIAQSGHSGWKRVNTYTIVGIFLSHHSQHSQVVRNRQRTVTVALTAC